MTVKAKEKQLYTVEEFMIRSKLFLALNDFVTARSFGVVVDNLEVRRRKNVPTPALAFVRAERAVEAKQPGRLSNLPDLAVEIMSANDRWSDITKRVRLYLEAKTKLVWLINQFDRDVNVYRLDRPRRLLLIDDEVDGEDVIPGFTLKVRSLFE